MTIFEYAQIATAIGSTIIAMTALAVAIYEGRSNRKHNRLSMKPAIVLETSSESSPPTINVSIVNAGLGPAEITKVQFFKHGKELSGDLEYELKLAISNILEKIMVETTTVSVMNPGYILRSSAENCVAKIKLSPTEPTCIENLTELLGVIDMRVEYQSFYGEADAYDSREI
ncbi:hypothetical protein [Neptuniibacter sp. CAU 1671]|uniref:hypothetical protein n=1 Tax=Neptuniibacter sp. CAU 1671 TaxID=3032593 RepID=UPI0023DA25B5|nr:hypothetical protein [Neptuniibacter sp. CAU 1671]MDF2182208.1 hypothetical protein [Neptuniibacter sp. CAU 1671]